MRYLSVCSGIEAATVAWRPLGWDAAAYSEIEAFPRAVLKHHYPNTPLHGDFTTIQGDEYGAVDLLVGGTPCQSFSVAGLRKGMDDPRGNLALAYLALAERTRARWLVWENVPGVLSSNGGRDFGSFLGGLAELGYGFAYRVLDAQYFGVPQRRRRVFIVGHLGDWRRAAAVLFERHSLSGHSPPSREAGEGSATRPGHCAPLTRWWDGGQIAATITTKSDDQRMPDKGNAQPLVEAPPTIGFGWQNAAAQGDDVREEQSPTLDKSKTPAVAVDVYNGAIDGDVAATFGAESGATNHAGPKPMHGMAVRRITPREAERLQGFPDDYTRIPWRKKAPEDCPDGPRYKALGNSMAVPVMRWIGERIAAVDALQDSEVAA